MNTNLLNIKAATKIENFFDFDFSITDALERCIKTLDKNIH